MLRTCYGETGVVDFGIYCTLYALNADLHPLNHGLNSAWRRTCPGQRTMEATRGDGYAPAWGSLVMMMMMMMRHTPVHVVS